MNKIIVFIVLVFPVVVFGQDGFTKRNHEAIIYTDFINGLSDTIKVVLPATAYTEHTFDGGSELIGIFHNQRLVKISTFFGLSYGTNTCHYYLKDENLFLVNEVFNRFKYDIDSNTMDYSEFDGGANAWYLFKNKELIDTESLGHWRFEDDEIDPEKVLIEEYSKYKKLLLKNKN